MDIFKGVSFNAQGCGHGLNSDRSASELGAQCLQVSTIHCVETPLIYVQAIQGACRDLFSDAFVTTNLGEVSDTSQ